MTGKLRIHQTRALCVSVRCQQSSQAIMSLTMTILQDGFGVYFAETATGLKAGSEAFVYEPGAILMQYHSFGTFVNTGKTHAKHDWMSTIQEPRSWLVRLYHRLKRNVNGGLGNEICR